MTVEQLCLYLCFSHGFVTLKEYNAAPIDMTAERLRMYLRVSHGSVSTEYGVGSIINNILFGTDGMTGYI